jgi:hypothetical protein
MPDDILGFRLDETKGLMRDDILGLILLEMPGFKELLTLGFFDEDILGSRLLGILMALLPIISTGTKVVAKNKLCF